MPYQQDRELGWDENIDGDAQPNALLPKGEYPFEVARLERLRYQGGEKLPPCNKAAITLRVFDEETGGRATVTHNLFMLETRKDQIAQFFLSIGLKQRGEPFTPQWNAIIGRTGRAKVSVRKYRAKNGEEREANQIDWFFDPPDAAPAQAQPPAQAAGRGAGGWGGEGF